MFDGCVLGVDPGVARTGLAILASGDRRPSLTWSETVVTPGDLPEADRLRAIGEAVRSAIAAYGPTALALERVAFNRNTVSALRVARATGVVMAAASEAGVPVEEYAPSEVKSTVTGMGSADKRQVRDALVRVHGLRDAPMQPDAADAVAVALCHLAAAPLRRAARRAAVR
jgi:crossover junction endodeoxyribonuclease RuvC